MRISVRAGGFAACTIGLLLGCEGALPAHASEALGALLACRQVASDPARLACFDRESAALVAAPRSGAVSPRASPRAVAGAQAPSRAALSATGLDPEQTFGLAPLQIAARQAAAEKLPRRLDHIAARITALSSAADGREIFTLDNSQVWMELEPEATVEPRVGESVEISRGWLGSYWLSLPTRRGCKVTRLR
jgi:hypothetical protein